MLVGAFIEEIISPIPSFVVMIPAGAAAQVQQIGWWYLPVLALIGAAGRLVASVILYVLADKGEDLLFGKGRRLFGLSHKQLEKYGERLSGTKRDWVALFMLNAIPILPTSLLSLACGFIKVNFKMFMITTYFGSAVNALIYMSIGYAGIQAADTLQNFNVFFQIITIILVIMLLVWLLRYQQRRRRKSKLV